MQSALFSLKSVGICMLTAAVATALLAIPAFGAGGDVLTHFGDTPQPGKQEAVASVTDSTGRIIVTGFRNTEGGIKDAYYTVKFNPYSSSVSWRATLDKSTESDRATAVAVDSEDNVIVSGYIWNGQNKDIHTVKYNGRTGAVMWEHTFNGSARGHDVASAIAVDALNNVLVAGQSQNSDGNNDFLVLKYSPNGPNAEGKPIWQVMLDGRIEFPAFLDKAMFVDEVNAIAIGNTYFAVTGYSWNGTDFDYLTAKYSLDGSLIWKKRYSSPGMYPDMGQYLKADMAGNIIVAGMTSTVSNQDITTVKYSSGDGTMLWSKTYDAGNNDEPGGLAVDGAGDVYLTGYSFTLSGNKDFYTVKYRDPTSGSSPRVLWEKTFNSAGENADVPTAIMLDDAGNVYVTGYTFAGGNYDYQTIKYKNEVGAIEGAPNNNGAELWHQAFNSQTNNNDMPVGISLSTLDEIPGVYVSGWSEQAAADYDYYVVKYDPGTLNPPSDLAKGALAKNPATGEYSIPLSWIVNSTTEQGFVIERKDPNAQEFVRLATVPTDPLPSGTTSYTDTGLAEDRYYCYRVKAVSAAGDSAYSDPLCVLTMIVTPIEPVMDYRYNGRNDSDDFVTGIAVGKDKNPVVTGYSLDFAPGYSTGTVSTDFFTTRLRATDLSLLWSDQFEGGFNQDDDAIGLAVDANNNVVITGNSYQDVGGDDNVNSIYTIKYGAAAPATKLWQGQYNGPSQIDDRAKAVAAAVDGSNNSVVIGHGKNASGNEDIYVVKYTANPAVDSKGLAIPDWKATPFDSGGDDYPAAVAYDRDGNVFVTGYREMVPGSNLYGIFTAKYCGSGTANPTCNNKSKGEIVWSDTYSGTGNCQARGLAVDQNGDVYVTGYGLNGAIPGNDDFITIKYSGSTGAVMWLPPKTFDGNYHGTDRAVAIKIDPVDNNIVVTGTTETASGDHDFHTIRYTAEGTIVWERTHKRSTSDDNANAMGMDLSGNIFVVGNTTAALNTDSTAIIYDFEGNLSGETNYNNAASVNGIDDAVAVAVNDNGEAFVAGYSTNASSGANGPNADYHVYKIAGVPVQAPYPLAVIENYTRATLNWADNTGTKTGYDLERKVGTCADTSKIWVPLVGSPVSSAVHTYTDTGLTEGASYCYRVRAFAATGKPTRWIERQTVMQTPPSPATFTATPVNTTTVNLSWVDKTTGESGFEIQRCEGTSCTFREDENTTTLSVLANATAYVDATVCPGKIYRYRILAYRTNEAGTGSEWDSEFTETAPITTPGTVLPGNVTISPLNESQLKISWQDSSTDESGYRIYECPGGDCSTLTAGNVIGVTTAGATSFTQHGLIPNSNHTYVVRAFKTGIQSCGGEWESNSAGPVSAATLNNPPVLTASKINTTQIDLSWSNITAAETGFELQRCVSGDCTSDAHFATLTTSGPNVTGYSDTAVCQGSINNYRIRAINEGLSLRGGNGAGVWTKRALLNITDFQPNLQTKMVITRSSYTGMRSDYADIRFYDATAKTELAYWIDPSLMTATSATVWVKTGNNKNIYLYYGNVDAVSASSGSATFDFFDDFNGTTLGAAWSKSTIDTATITVGSGLVTLDSPSYKNATISAGLTPPYRLEARTKVYSAYLGQYLIRIRGMGGIGDTGLFDVGLAKIQAYFDSVATGVQVPTDTFVRWHAAHTGGTTNSWGVYREDNSKIYETSYAGSPAGISFSAGDTGGGNGKFSLDWVLARKYAATEPRVTIGAAEDWSSSFDNTWTGAWSTPLTTRATDAAVAPVGAIATRVSEAEIRINFNYSFGDITGIKVDRCTDSSCTAFVRTLEASPGAASIADNFSLQHDTHYYYRVHSYKTATCGWDSNDISQVKVDATTALVRPTINATPATSITTSCNDLRFVDSDGITPLNYWIESGCNTNRTKVHVKIPRIGANSSKQISLYQGNSPALGKSDGGLTFDFFDDFTGTNFDASKWTLTAGVNNTDYVVGGGLLQGKRTDFLLTSTQQWSTGYSIQAKAKTTALAPYDIGHSVLSLRNGSNNAGWQLHDNGTARFIKNGVVVSTGSAPAGAAITDTIIFTLAMPDAVNVTPASFDAEPTVLATFFTPASVDRSFTAGNIVLGRSVTNASVGYNYTTDWDWVRVRKASSTVGVQFTLLDQPVAGSYDVPNGSGGNEAGKWAVRRLLTVANTGSTDANNWQATVDKIGAISLDTTSLASDQVVISWTPGTVTETSYKIERCEGNGCSASTFDGGVQKIFDGAAGATAYTDRDIKAATKYCYRVSAERIVVPPTRIWTTAPSDVVCATTSAIPVAPVLTVVEHETAMDLSWNDVGIGENAYVVQRCTGTCDPATAPEVTTMLAPGTTSYTDTTVCNNTYTYVVKAVKYGANAWDSGFSAPVTKGTIVPAAPIFIAATRITENQINLVWQDKTGDESGFEIERCEGAGCDFSTKTILQAPASSGVGGINSYSDAGIKPGISYRYHIRAYKTGGSCGWPSDYSADIREATTSVAAPLAFSGSGASTTSVNLTWFDQIQSETGFKVERCLASGSCAAPMDFTSVVQAAKKRVFYSFNNSLTDSSGNGLHLSGSTPTYEDGGLALNTTTSFQSATTSILNNDTHAIEFDFKIRATNAGYTKIFGYIPTSSDRSPGIWLKDGNSPTLHWRYHDVYKNNTGVTSLGVDGDTSIPFVVGQWYHVRGAKNGSSLKMYVNGVLVSDTTVANPKYAGDSVLWFGGADVTIKNFSIDWNDSPITVTDTTACSDTVYNYRVKATNTLTLPSGGNGCWSSRSPLVIINFKANFLTRVVIPYDADMQPDYRDLRFTDAIANIDLPYWIQSSDAGSATVWLKTGENNAITLSYGNAAAVSRSSMADVMGTGLVGYWPFEESINTTAGTTADMSGNGKNGTLNGFLAGYGVISGGKIGNGLNLDGTNDYVTVPDTTGSVLDLTGSMTAELWYNHPAANPQYTRILSKGVYPDEAYMFMFDANGTGVAFLINSGSNQYVQSPVGPVLTAGWHHLVGRYDSIAKTVSIFVDGVEYVTTLATSRTIVTNNSALGIGAQSTGGGPTKGVLDEVRLYNRPLLNSEIASRYAAILPEVTVGPKYMPGGGCSGYHYEGPYGPAYTVVTPAVGGNLIPANADFTNGLTSWTTFGNGVSAGSMTFSGMKSAKVSTTMASGSQSAGFTQNLNGADVTPGRSYRLYANIKTKLDKTGTGTTLAFCRLDNTGIGNPDTLGRELQIRADSSMNDNTWYHMPPLDITLKAGVTSARVMCGIWSSDGQSKTHTAHFSGLQLVPNPVVELTATRISEAHVSLSWKDSIPDKSGYRLERCNQETCLDGDFIQLATDMPITTKNYADVVPAANVLYTYRIKAYKSAPCSWSVISNIVPVLTNVTAPIGLTATPTTTTSIDLNWSNSTLTETGFTLERCIGAGCSNYSTDFPFSNLGPGISSVSDTSVCNDTTYQYQLKSYKNGLSKGGAGCWTRRKDLTVRDHVPAFQMFYTIVKDDDMQADYRDLRFYDPTANIELPYWVESYDASSAKVWIKTGMSTTIQMYYGNSSASAVSNPRQVFDFYDDFAGNVIDSGKWTKVDPNGFISQNNELIVSGGEPGLYSVQNFTRPFVYEINAFTDAGSRNYSGFGIKKANTGIAFTDLIYNFFVSYWNNISVYEAYNERLDTGQTLPEASYKYFRIDVMQTGAKYYYGNSVDTAIKYYESSYSAESPVKIGFSNYLRKMRYDTVRVRRYAAVEPAVSITGTENILGSCPTFAAAWESPIATAQAKTPAPVAPTGLSLEVISDTAIKLNWSDSTPDETGFKIERCEDGGSGCDPVAMTPAVLAGAGTTSYQDASVTGSKTYCYKVRATKDSSCGWDSAATNVQCAKAMPASVGQTLTAVPVNSRTIRLSWVDNATDETGYEVAILLWNGRWTTIGSVGSNKTIFIHAEGLEPNKTYTYMVRPFRITGGTAEYSTYSNPASATTPFFGDAPPECPLPEE